MTAEHTAVCVRGRTVAVVSRTPAGPKITAQGALQSLDAAECVEAASSLALHWPEPASVEDCYQMLVVAGMPDGGVK